MFSSPAPTKPLYSAGKRNHSIHSPHRVAPKSAASVSPGGDNTSTVQNEPKNAFYRRGFIHDVREEVFSCRPEYIVSALSGVPQEVQQTMRSYGPEFLQCRGLIDSVTSCALVSLREETFVWKYASTAAAVQPCYIFPNPIPPDSCEIPYSCLVPYHSSQEPGLILCALTGDVRFWFSISAGLTGGDDYQTINLRLSVGESVINMLRLDAASFLAFSSRGRLFRFSISSSGGKRHCDARPIYDRKRFLSRVTTSLFAPVMAPAQTIRTVSIALEPQSDCTRSIVWTANDRNIQRWAIATDTWDELLFDQNVDALLSAQLSQEIPIEPLFASQLQISLHDIAIARPGTMIVLLSYNVLEQVSGNERLARAFCLAHLSWSNNMLSVANIELLPYISNTSDSTAKVKLIGDGRDVAFIHFKDSIIVRSLRQEDAFQSVLSIKSPWNCVLDVESHSDPSLGSLIIQTLENGLLTCRLNVERIQTSGSETLINRLRATLEQEIFFGANLENPFRFRPESHLCGNVGLAAEQLSSDILGSRSDFLTTTFSSDLRIDLAEKRNRLSLLIQFISNTGALGTLSELSRQRLWLDANRLCVGQELWSYIDRNTGDENQSMLVRAIVNTAHKLGAGDGKDSVRLFFRSQLYHIDALFDELRALAENVGYERDQLTTKAMIVMECSQVLLTIWGTSERHRLASLDVYGIGGVVLVPIWGDGTNHIRVAQFFLEEAVQCLMILFRSGAGTESLIQRRLEARLHDLASMTLSMWDMSYDLLASDPSHDPAAKSGLAKFRENFATARSQIFGALVEWGGAETAFDLADQYHEYGFLVQLCTHPNLGGSAKTMYYLRKYHEAFAFHLYKWYLENGHLSALLDPIPEFIPLVGAFFSTSHYPRLEWIHDVAKPVSKFESAATALETAYQAENRLDVKQVLLSLTKLASVASNGIANRYEREHVEIVSNELDRVSVQQVLYQEFQAILDPFLSTSADLLSDEISKRCIAENLANESSFRMVFKHLVKRILTGTVLNADELAMILSMKDTGARRNDLRAAVLITRQHEISNYALEAVWRRCYLADNWRDFKNTATEHMLDEVLQSTCLYTCVTAARVAEDGEIPLPQQVFTPPPVADLSSKHPDLTATQVSELRAAYERECKSIACLVNEIGLLDWVDRLLS